MSDKEMTATVILPRDNVTKSKTSHGLISTISTGY